jgi:TonB family protein
MFCSQLRIISKVGSVTTGRWFKGDLLLSAVIFGLCLTISSCQDATATDDSRRQLSVLDNKESVNATGIETDATVPYSDLSVKPELLQKVEPVYPKEARKSGIEGMVMVKILVDTSGNVAKTEIIKSVPPLDEAALEAARHFKFKAGQINGKAVKTWMTIPFKFKLGDKK